MRFKRKYIKDGKRCSSWKRTRLLYIKLKTDRLKESNVRRHILNAFREGELERDENNVQKIHVNGVTFGGATLSARKAV